MNGFLSIKEVGDIVGVHIVTIHKYIRQGFFPASKVNGFLKVNSKDLLVYLKTIHAPDLFKADEVNIRNYLWERDDITLNQTRTNIKLLLSGMQAVNAEDISRQYKNDLKKEINELREYVPEDEVILFVAECLGIDKKKMRVQLNKMKCAEILYQ